jgi:hypothetical protein
MRAFGETTATRPDFSTCLARSDATRSVDSPGEVETESVLPSTRRRISPPLAATPRSSPIATRCDGGGSTVRTSIDRASPKVTPH